MEKKTGWVYFGFYLLAGLVLSGFVGVVFGLSYNWILAVGIVMLVSLVAAAPLIDSFRGILGALNRYENGLPVRALRESRLDPLGGLARRVNRLTMAAQQAAGLRERWLSQANRQAAQEERNRLARDLHDSIKQQLFSIQMSAAAAQERFDTDAAGAQKAIGDVRRLAHEALVEMNALLQQLSPAPLERVGLAQAIREQCEALSYRSGAMVECEVGDLPGEALLPPGAQEAVFRVAQEALSNVARHARAKHVSVDLREDESTGEVVLAVRDDGQGFEAKNVQAGSGLEGMRARAAALEGKLTVESQPGLGTLLTFRVPYQVAEEVEAEKLPPVLGRVILAGLLGGAVISAVLIQPWGQIHAGQIGEIWTPAGYSWSVVLQILALVLLPVVGWLAARWVKPGTRGGAALIGAAAGAIAGLTLFGMIGASFVGSRGAMPILLHGLELTSGGAQTASLLISSFNNIFLMVHLSVWALLGVSAGLGMLGGMAGHRVGLPALNIQRYAPVIRVAVTAMAGGGAIGVFITAMLLPMAEASMLEGMSRQALSGMLVQSRAAMVMAFLTPAVFFFSGLALSRRLLKAEIVWAEAKHLPRYLREAYQLACLALWVTVGAALWMGAYLFLSVSQYTALPIVSILLLAGVSIVGLGMSIWIGKLALELRRGLRELGKPHLTDAEAAAMFLLPFFPLLALLGIWYGAWMEGIALAVLATGAGFAFYAQANRRGEKRAVQYWAGQTASFAAAWPGIVMGFVAPLTPVLAAGLAVLSLVVRVVPFLDNFEQPQGLTVIGMLSEYTAYQVLSFAGMLLLCAALTGVIGLFGYLRASLARRSV